MIKFFQFSLKLFFTAITTLLFHNSSFCQHFVTGFVIDETNNTGIEGAIIGSELDTTVCNVAGYFKIEITDTPSQISISSLGYESTFFTIQNDKALRISLTPDITELNHVIINSGISFNKAINTSTSIASIDKAQMLRDSPFSITNALNRVPGVFMHSGALNTNRITIRGIGSRSLFSTDKVKAYYDQIPLTDGSGNSSLEDIDQSLIQRISIIKGPNSSIYGAGLGGVIQLKSINPSFNETAIESSLTVGSYATRRWMNKASIAQKDLLLNIVYSDFESDGYRNNNRIEKKQVGLTGKYFFKGNNHLSIVAIHTDLLAQIPSSINESDYKSNPRLAAANWQEAQGYEDYKRNLIGISYNYTPKQNLSISHAVSFQSRDSYEPAPGPFVNIQDEQLNGLSTRHVANLQLSNWKLSGGFEWYRDARSYQEFQNLHSPSSNGSVKGSESDHFDETRSYINAFAEMNYQPNKKLKFIAGLNLNKTQYELNDLFNEGIMDRTGSYSFNAIVSPRLGSVFHINSKTNWFTNISHGFSPPNLEQTLFPDGQINPNIKPESGWNFESGLRGDFSNLNYDISLYYMQIRNLLVGRRTLEDVYIGVNAGENRHWGADISLDYLVPFNNSSLRIFQVATLAHYRFEEFVDDGEDYSGNKLTGVPSINLSSGVELLNTQGFYGNINAQYTGKMPMLDDNSLFSTDYLIIRSKAGFRKLIGHFDIDLSIGVDNVTNKKYASMLLINTVSRRYYYPGLPRNYFGGLSLRYNFN